MYFHESRIRVRYGETDAMGVVYYGVYPLYYETGRTEMMRHLGFTYRISLNWSSNPVLDNTGLINCCSLP